MSTHPGTRDNKDDQQSTAGLSAIAEGFDTSSHKDFYEYYKRKSLSPQTMRRFGDVADAVLRIRDPLKVGASLDVLDIGCGAGAQSSLWAGKGHRYQGLDVNEPLIRLARDRVAEQGRSARFHVGSATSLPFPDASFDVCLLPELLEHVEDWRSVLNEAVRVLRPGGVLFLSTTNRLCPKQQEFNLPGYAWYPSFVKRWVVRRALTDWPAVANHAKYPAVHWFTFYGLSAFFAIHGLESFDRFDIMQLDNKSRAVRRLISILRTVPALRFCAHVLTPGTTLIAQRAIR